MNSSLESTAQRPKRNWLAGFWRLLLPLFVLAAGGAVAVTLIKTSPKAQRKPPPRPARLVEVQPITFSARRTLIHAMGTVQPAREVELRPRVTGEIVRVSDEFVPGGRFEEGQTLLQIDPADFELAARQRESEVAQAQSALTRELGQQSVALHEYELLGETIRDEDRDLILRKPQLEEVRARLQTAEAALEQARLNLSRATVKAPFNATIRSRNVNLGVQVAVTTILATLTGTDEYWVAVTVPLDQLPWICIPDRPRLPSTPPNASSQMARPDTDFRRDCDESGGSMVRVFTEATSGTNRFRLGRVIRLLPDLEKEGRMARLLVSVPDPLALQATNLGKPALMLGDYVRVEIDGIEMSSVAAVNRQIFRDGDQVWVIDDQNRLTIRPVAVTFRGRDQLWVTAGLQEGERVVVTDLAAPIEGMLLRTQEDPAPISGGPPADATHRQGKQP